jgi:hypothetical protein
LGGGGVVAEFYFVFAEHLLGEGEADAGVGDDQVIVDTL